MLGLQRPLIVPLALLILSAIGCVGTETGNPPATLQPNELGGMRVLFDPATPSPSNISIFGGPGAVEPPSGEIYAYPLLNNAAPFVAPVQADGSFELELSAGPSEPVRLHAVDASGVVSVPLDVRVADSLELVEPANACLVISPEPILLLGSIEEDALVRVVNRCERTVLRTRGRFRVGGEGSLLSDRDALGLGPGESATITLRVGQSGIGPTDILIIAVQEPFDEVRAVSLVIP